MNIPEIEHGFFEKGHSFMECESVHGRIDKATKDKEIFDPTGWYTAVKMAGKQFIVVEMTEFFDAKQLKQDIITSKKKADLIWI